VNEAACAHRGVVSRKLQRDTWLCLDCGKEFYPVRAETWIDRNYRTIMLLSMLVELLLIGYIAWRAH
jgi:hypothetical protein